MAARSQQQKQTNAGEMLAFTATLQQAAHGKSEQALWFVILPRDVSEQLPRRGRTSVKGRLNAAPFEITLEPDGQLSHWIRVDKALLKTSGAKAGDVVSVELAPVECEPEPRIPEALQKLLDASPAALTTWNATTKIARVDWIHWIESAKQAITRDKRTQDAVSMLASGKRRVCCFDPSGYYAKNMCTPEVEST